jgi:hypothetical protein
MGARLAWITPSLVVALFLLGYLGLTLARHGGNPLAFARLGEGFAEGEPVGEPGYDGQFAYWVALDPRPSAAAPHLDVPAYRYQRLLYPLLTRTLALGQPGLVPWTLVALNLAAQVGLTWLMERWLAEHGFSRWYALTVGLWAGLVMSVRLDLSEPVCFLLATGAVLLVYRGRVGWAATLLALALLTKETALLFATGLLAWAALTRRWAALGVLSLSLAPFAVLQLLLLRWFGSVGLVTGGHMATPLELIPYNGLWRVAAVSGPAFVLLLVLFGPMVVAPSVWGSLAALRQVLRGAATPAALVLGANAAFMALTPFSTFREPLAVVRLATGMVIATVLFGAETRSRRVLTYALLWLAALALVVRE